MAVLGRLDRALLCLVWASGARRIRIRAGSGLGMDCSKCATVAQRWDFRMGGCGGSTARGTGNLYVAVAGAVWRGEGAVVLLWVWMRGRG
ncbi:hypothetical protein XFUD_10455 [Xylella fastidiosa]|nr:hypothetical protein XFUD_10455 [Xylella fastidiosa]ETE34625.1 hypothetical protein B398_03020 [Xylella fastidiosa 32]OCA57192.1 hypothetical protein AA93_10275 [Xylella fastidiosa subsp. pauca 11399]ALR01390.1 hypothetical protein OY18_03095 [Xylella fastidiosa]KXB13232.1 hypothetical protein ADT29_08865 [Xylella fastidiosa]